MQFQYSPYMLPLIGAAFISGWVAVYIQRRRATRSAPALGILAFAIMMWSLGYALEIAGVDLPTKEFWGKAQYLGIVTAPLMWIIFAFNHSRRSKQMARRDMLLLAVVPLITLVLALTNDSHGLIWTEVHITTTGDFSALGVSYGVWFWVHSAYSYLLLLLGTIFIIRSIGRMPGLYRGQAIVLLMAVLAPWVANILYLAHIGPLPNLDLTPFAFALTVVALTWGILGFQLIDLSPVARDVVVEEMNDGMIVLDARNRIADINPAAQRMIGLSGPQAIGRMATEVFSAWSHLTERFGNVMEAQDEIMLGEGEARRWYELRLAPLKDQRQRIAGRVITLRNITERKQVEDSLLQERGLLRTVIDNVPDQIFARDTACRFILCNQSDARAMGVIDPEMLLGKTDFDFYPPDLAAQYQADDLAVMHSGQPIFNREERAGEVDGQPRWVITTKVPLHDRQGQVVGLVGIARDITERKRAEEELRKSKEELEQRVAERTAELRNANEHLQLQLAERMQMEETLRKLSRAVEQSPASIVITDTAGAIEYVNPRFTETTGYTLEEAIGQNPRILKSEQTPPEEYAHLWHTITAGGVWRGEFCNKKKNGDLHWEATSISPVTNDAGAITHFIAVKEDITERKRAEADIQRHVRHLAILHDIDRAITSTLDLDQVLVLLLEHVRQAADAEACSVALVDRETGDLVFRQAAGAASRAMIGLRLKFGQGLVGWVAAHRQTAVVPDTSVDSRFHREVDTRTGFITRDLMGVPVIIHDTVVGVIELLNKRGRTFSEEDVQLLESVAAQAAIAIENARLFETERTGRQRLETLYRIGQTINSTLDTDAILDQLTDAAMQATHATHGAALVVSPEHPRFDRRSLRGYSPELAGKARAMLLPLDQGVNGRAYRTRQVVYVRDVRTDPNYFPLIPDTRSELAVPILRSGQALGNLDLQSSEQDAFRDVDLDFLQALTDQVAIALENARLFEETRRRLDEMSVVSNVALVGAAGRPFDETISRATDALARLWPDASLGYMFVDEDDQSLHLHPTYHGFAPEISAHWRIPLGHDIIGWAARERQPIRVGDVQSDPRYVVKDPAVRSEMVAPLVVGKRAIGVVNVASPRLDAFSGDDLRLLTTLAGQLATIFEKARLDTALEAERASLARRVEERTAELRVANDQLRQAHEEVSRALEKERELGELKTRFISMASHEFRTPLATILSSAELLERYSHKWTADKMVEHLHRIQTATQNMTVLLEDVLLVGKAEAGKLEFTPAAMNLDKFCRDMMEELQLGLGAKHSLVLTVEGDGTAAYMDEKLLRHILSNLLSNAIKYSPPGSEVYLGLTCQAGQASLVIRDQGIGIPPADRARLFEAFHRAGNVKNIPGTGLGLAIVKKSVDVHGGTIVVDSQVGVGTSFTISLPMKPR